MDESKLCASEGANPVPEDCVSGCTCPPPPPDADTNVPASCFPGRPPSQLDAVLREHLQWASLSNGYNEIVVDTASVVAGLPASVDAFFFLSSTAEDQRQEIRRAHEDFLGMYGLGDGGGGQRGQLSRVPLLELDLGGSDRPLRRVSP